MTITRTARVLSALGLGIALGLVAGPAASADAAAIRITPIKMLPVKPPVVYCLHGLGPTLLPPSPCPPWGTLGWPA